MTNLKERDPHVLRVLGLDPSFRNWGYAYATYDLQEGTLKVHKVELLTTEASKVKSVRKSSDDFQNALLLRRALSRRIAEHRTQLIFSEIPQGSQSAKAARGLGIALGVLASVDVTVMQVQPLETKMALVGVKQANKQQMIDAAYERYPKAEGWLTRKYTGKILPIASMEHVADAIGVLLAGVQTPQFLELRGTLRALEGSVE